MAEQHVGVDIPDADTVSEEEKNFFIKSRTWTDNIIAVWQLVFLDYSRYNVLHSAHYI